ncbi:MAG: succinate dehydrogenase assembly factor 2 [Paracoccaceae bacterium]|nr:succinate dehydrogenase assembly factor 2 [Loktanella sp.]
MTPREITIKRLRMRSMRRGIKEMDLILIDYSTRRLDTLSDAEIETYDALLAENDQQIYAWILGTDPAPEPYAPLIAELRANAEGLTRPSA